MSRCFQCNATDGHLPKCPAVYVEPMPRQYCRDCRGVLPGQGVIGPLERECICHRFINSGFTKARVVALCRVPGVVDVALDEIDDMERLPITLMIESRADVAAVVADVEAAIEEERPIAFAYTITTKEATP